MKEDYALDTLLSMHGYQFVTSTGYWWKIEAYHVQPSEFRPHGIRYNLTLHDASNRRVFGMDNAHAVKFPNKGKFSGRVMMYDHVHKTVMDKGTPYEFTSAQQLLSDFFSNVDRIVAEVTKEI